MMKPFQAPTSFRVDVPFSLGADSESATFSALGEAWFLIPFHPPIFFLSFPSRPTDSPSLPASASLRPPTPHFHISACCFQEHLNSLGEVAAPLPVPIIQRTCEGASVLFILAAVHPIAISLCPVACTSYFSHRQVPNCDQVDSGERRSCQECDSWFVPLFPSVPLQIILALGLREYVECLHRFAEERRDLTLPLKVPHRMMTSPTHGFVKSGHLTCTVTLTPVFDVWTLERLAEMLSSVAGDFPLPDYCTPFIATLVAAAKRDYSLVDLDRPFATLARLAHSRGLPLCLLF
jgi:hypothetical protein